jgi:hypothetical protein
MPEIIAVVKFRKDLDEQTRAQLIHVPALYNILKHHTAVTVANSPYPLELLGTIDWMADRGIDVIARLTNREGQTPLEGPKQIIEDPWEEVSQQIGHNKRKCHLPIFCRADVIIVCLLSGYGPGILNCDMTRSTRGATEVLLVPNTMVNTASNV